MSYGGIDYYRIRLYKKNDQITRSRSEPVRDRESEKQNQRPPPETRLETKVDRKRRRGGELGPLGGKDGDSWSWRGSWARTRGLLPRYWVPVQSSPRVNSGSNIGSCPPGVWAQGRYRYFHISDGWAGAQTPGAPAS